MNRRGFLGLLGTGAAGLALAPRGLVVGPVVHDGSAWVPVVDALKIRIGQGIGYFTGTDVLNRGVVVTIEIRKIDPLPEPLPEGVNWDLTFKGVGGYSVTALTPGRMYTFNHREGGELVGHGCQSRRKGIYSNFRLHPEKCVPA